MDLVKNLIDWIFFHIFDTFLADKIEEMALEECLNI